ncbi:hypothetical protein GGI19_005859 [Coemansia pectinata]|uniref:AAA-ATPase-like domain-containing protein n=1 Tax=Coemansia pectinata TaxID=1052879 RepID=A0A9W8L976_9FUNG|nr:hypothetical protein GGI19_005859 [Coemansia pectinata]
MIALAPRGSGKSTFLSILAEYLALHSKVPRETRLEYFRTYDLYTKRRGFFDEHFAKYPVIHLDFSGHEPQTVEHASRCLQTSVRIATCHIVDHLSTFLEVPADEGHIGLYQSARARKQAIKHVAALFDKLEHSADDIQLANTFMANLIATLYMCLGGEQSVVLIDELDKPIVHLMCTSDIPQGVREGIVSIYTSFYTTVFKPSQDIFAGTKIESMSPECHPNVQGRVAAFVLAKQAMCVPLVDLVKSAKTRTLGYLSLIHPIARGHGFFVTRFRFAVDLLEL